VVTGVNEVRAYLKRCDPQTPLDQSRHQSQTYCGFAAAAFGAANDDSFDCSLLSFLVVPYRQFVADVD
jgi:hypothetical protein